MSQGEQIARAAGVVLVMNLLSRALGFVRDAAIAYRFGAGKATDAYMVAYTWPYLIQAVLGFALVSAVVPVFTGYLVKDRKQEAWRAGSNLLNLAAVLLTGISIAGILGSPGLVKITAPGFSTEQTKLTIELTRIMFPSVLFMGLGMLVTGMLNAHRYFAVPAFAPGFTNIIIIVTVLFFAEDFNVHRLALGTLIGFIGFLLIQIPALVRLGFQYSFSFDWRHPAVQKIFWTVGPVILGISVNQIYLALNRVFASGLPPGSLSALEYAYRLMSLPLGIFVAAVSTAIFPAMAEQAIGKKNRELSTTLVQGLGMVLVVAVPAAVGLAVLREPLVRLLLERGAFDRRATLFTASALLYFAGGLIPLAFNMIITRAYYALDDARTPVVTGLLSVGINVILSMIFLPVMAHTGLALANSLAAAANSLLLYRGLRKHLGRLPDRRIGKSLAGTGAASLAMAVVVFKVSGAIRTWSGLAGMKLLLAEVGVGIITGVICFGFLAAMLRVKEVELLMHTLLRARPFPRK
ncbi:murein biosynthesis integral membrane protein MurJ [Calderihabitans maritimus]|uniref:Probable lipid II flippase MurJ n=1 Tax=Calderihabitans maritimus TaxID=1246530 RepID=A0A1Z5HUP2_9FIRM|nr:murein biosynthesis integral membrane protein MurJ [Calderihabitans maritimus]GAW93128.1 integral membrane protein MviN [Calderihabitans maritimus]